MTAKNPKKTPDENGGHDENLKQKAAQTMADTMQAARDQATKAGEAAKDAAASRATAAKDAISDRGDDAAERLHAAADDREGTVGGRLLDVLAEGLGTASDDLRGMSVSSILSRTENFARRNPGAFVAGAAVAGFALARFARASQSHPTEAGRSSGEPEGRERAALVAGHPQPHQAHTGTGSPSHPGGADERDPAVLVAGHPGSQQSGSDSGGEVQ